MIAIHIVETIAMTPDFRDDILRQLRQPGPKADMLIERYLGSPGEGAGVRAYTREVETALSLLPDGVHFLSGRFEEGKLFWCDVGFRPQVQAWGETLACAIAGAIFAYRTHPEVLAGNASTGLSRSSRPG